MPAGDLMLPSKVSKVSTGLQFQIGGGNQGVAPNRTVGGAE